VDQPDVLLVDLTPTMMASEVAAMPEAAELIGDDRIDLIVNDVYWAYSGRTE